MSSVNAQNQASSSAKPLAGESVWVQILKVLMLSACESVYTMELCDDTSRIAVIVCSVVAGCLAGALSHFRIRLIWILIVSALLTGFGCFGALALMNGSVTDFFGVLSTSRIIYYGSLAFGITLALRSLSLRYQVARLIESCVTLGALVFVFFSHRDYNIQNPREFADWAYSNGKDPIELYRYMGVGAGFLSLIFWLGRSKFLRTLYAFVILALVALILAQLSSYSAIMSSTEDPLGLFSNNDDSKSNDKDSDKDDDDDSSKGKNDNDDNNDDNGDSSNDNNGDNSDNNDDNNGNGKNNGNKGGNSDSDTNVPPDNPPTPVAIAVFYDEFEPADGIFHFRQSVLSHYDGNHLVKSDEDSDVISSFPYKQEITALDIQSRSVHKTIQTSMFLLQDTSQPPQLAMGQRVFPIENPNKKMFIAAYGVDSLGLTSDVTRFIGRKSVPDSWDAAKKEHYLKIPDDPRYKALSDIIVRQLDPRFYGEDIAKAILIKSWLEHEGYYTLKEKHVDADDPTASFLFGSLRGYCVHFAHSAVYLLRSQGIAARVAIGFAVDNELRGTNSAVIIRGNMAHAWPEIYVDGIGWVTFDIFPENGDPQPAVFVDQSLESMFGELARDDKSAGKAEEPVHEPFTVPWDVIWYSILALLCGGIVILYTRKGIIILRGSTVKRAKDLPRSLRSTLKSWSCYGQAPAPGETLEHFAKTRGTATQRIVDATLAAKLGGQISDSEACEIAKLVSVARRDARRSVSFGRRIIAIFHL